MLVWKLVFFYRVWLEDLTSDYEREFVYVVFMIFSVKIIRPTNVKPINIEQYIMPSRGPISYIEIFFCSHVVFVKKRNQHVSSNYINTWFDFAWSVWIQTHVHLKFAVVLPLCAAASATNHWEAFQFDPISVLNHSTSQSTAKTYSHIPGDESEILLSERWCSATLHIFAVFRSFRKQSAFANHNGKIMS